MAWKPIVAGVDSSPEGIRAARTAVALARVAKTRCYLVHAVRDPWSQTYREVVATDFTEHSRMVLEAARAAVLATLKEHVPGTVLRTLDVRYGRTGAVLADAASRNDAELVVIGGKHHSALGRWIAGSTAHYLVRATERPLLIVGPETPGVEAQEGHYRRVLAAVDLSPASHHAILGAERFVRLFKGKLAALHVVELFPIPPAMPLGVDVDLLRRSEAELEQSIWPQFKVKNVERLVRRGPAADVVADTAREWKADLLVVGTHGYGWVDRILIGSVTERLLNRLPVSVLVVPVPSPGKGAPAGKPGRVGKPVRKRSRQLKRTRRRSA